MASYLLFVSSPFCGITSDEKSYRDSQMNDQYRPPENLNPADHNPYSFSTAVDRPMASSQVSIVRQVPTLGVLMAVQGALVSCLGLFMIGMGVFIPLMIELESQQNPSGAPPGGGEIFILTIYGGSGLVFLIIGGLTVYSGVQLYKFQSRGFAMVMLGVGCLAILSCYCFPTAVALAIFGYIVLTKIPVIHAFRIAEGSSMTTDEIIAELHKRIQDGMIAI